MNVLARSNTIKLMNKMGVSSLSNVTVKPNFNGI